MESMYLSKFHEELYKRAKILESSPPKRSLEEYIAQYHRIKAQSTRAENEQQIAEREDSLSTR
jgi:hypothetical protein